MMAKMIREMTEDGYTLVMFALRVFNGVEDGMKSERSRLWATEWLSERGFGKVPESVDEADAMSGVTPEQQAMVEALKLSPHERRARVEELRDKATSVPVKEPVDGDAS